MAVTPFQGTDNFNMAAFNGKIAEADSTYVTKTRGEMTGLLDMGNNKITSLATPTADTDAVNKGYVDGKTTFYEQGYYTGDGSKTKTITFSKKILCILIIGNSKLSYAKVEGKLYNGGVSIDAYVTLNNNSVTISTEIAGYADYFNKNDHSYYYFGLYE